MNRFWPLALLVALTTPDLARAGARLELELEAPFLGLATTDAFGASGTLASAWAYGALLGLHFGPAGGWGLAFLGSIREVGWTPPSSAQLDHGEATQVSAGLQYTNHFALVDLDISAQYGQRNILILAGPSELQLKTLGIPVFGANPTVYLFNGSRFRAGISGAAKAMVPRDDGQGLTTTFGYGWELGVVLKFGASSRLRLNGSYSKETVGFDRTQVSSKQTTSELGLKMALTFP